MSAEIPGTDILSSLFEDAGCDNNSTPGEVVNGRDHSVSLFLLSGGQSLLSAYVYNDKLLVLARREHSSVLKVYQSSSITQFGEHQLPVFSDNILFQQKIGSCSVPSKQLLSASIPYRPILSLLCCHSSVKSDTLASSVVLSATDIFFRQLFGFELSLARSTVAIVGTQSGAVLYFDTRGYCNPPSTKSSALLSNTLCNLGQPVVGIHALCLPTNSEQQQSDKSPANALLVSGRLGKLVLFTEAEKGREVPLVSEFSVAGPILSSLLVERHNFVYSNTRGIFRVCLQPSCLSKLASLDSTSTAPVMVPRSQFHSPCLVSATCMSFITGASSSPSPNESCTALAIDVDGTLHRFELESCKDTAKVSESLDVGREMKESMDSINKTGQRYLTVKSQLELVDSALIELNQAMSLLHLMQSSDSQVFSCTVSPVTERVGAHHFAMGAEVELCYTGKGELQRGWTLLVATQCTWSSGSRFTTLSLAGMAPNDSLKLRVKLELEIEMPATFSVVATVCYSANHLQSVLTQQLYTPSNIGLFNILESSGVAIPLVSAVFGALDFIQPCSPKLTHCTFAPISSHLPHTHDQQSHTLEMVLHNPNPRAEESITPAQRCRDVLDVLLPRTITESLSTGTNGAFQARVCSYDGSIVVIDMEIREEKCLLKIANTGTVSNMVEIISSICRRCHRKQETSLPAQVAASLQV